MGLFIHWWQDEDLEILALNEATLIVFEVLFDDVYFTFICWGLRRDNKIVTFLLLLQTGPVILFQIFRKVLYGLTLFKLERHVAHLITFWQISDVLFEK